MASATAMSTSSLSLPLLPSSPSSTNHVRNKKHSCYNFFLRRRRPFAIKFVASSEITKITTPMELDNGITSRRQLLLSEAIAAAAAALLLSRATPASFAAEAKKGFQVVSDNKGGYSFLYPFGWQEVVVQGQDKVFKDVIEPLESVSVNTIPTSKKDIRELGPPDQVADALIRKVLAPPSQKTKLVEASEHDVDGTAYYTFEFTAQAPNFTRHALGAISIANGKFYTLTTGANERRWEKMKDRLQTVIDSFKVEAR